MILDKERVGIGLNQIAQLARMSIFQNCIFTNPAGHWNVPRGVLLRILGGGVPPDSSIKSWAYFRPKNVVFRISFQTWRRSQNATYVFTKAEIMSSSLRLERQQEDIEFAYCPFFLIHFDWNDEYIHTLLWFPRKLYPFPDQNGQSIIYRFSDQIGAQTIPSLGRHIPIWFI